ncbi:hypothetical protein GYH30_027110 [Glycine max]|uniref:Uncharacterized protein n=1 Tax=Glycine max TaxID=3847 RepID=A0A0R0HPU9_SOYBN|nr:hypothetical protein GYH30_027110 [Glycine max]
MHLKHNYFYRPPSLPLSLASSPPPPSTTSPTTSSHPSSPPLPPSLAGPPPVSLPLSSLHVPILCHLPLLSLPIIFPNPKPKLNFHQTLSFPSLHLPPPRMSIASSNFALPPSPSSPAPSMSSTLVLPSVTTLTLFSFFNKSLLN